MHEFAVAAVEEWPEGQPIAADQRFAELTLRVVGRTPAPEAFDPDRWSSGAPPVSFVPFGGGRRPCIGDVFALTELVVVLATIPQRWRLVPVPGPPVRIDSTSVLKPDHLPMTPLPRVPRAG